MFLRVSVLVSWIAQARKVSLAHYPTDFGALEPRRLQRYLSVIDNQKGSRRWHSNDERPRTIVSYVFFFVLAARLAGEGTS